MGTPVRTDPSLLDRLLQECLAAILRAHPGQSPVEIRLSKFDQSAFEHQRSDIPQRLNALLESTFEAQGIRRVDPVAIDGYVLHTQGVYFVRCSSYNAEMEPITHPSSDMVLFEINPYRRVLVVGKRFASESAIAAALQDRDAQVTPRQRPALNGNRRQEVAAAHQRVLELIDAAVESSDDTYAQHKWRRIERSEISLKDVLTICSLLDIELAPLIARPPTAPEATP